MKKIILPFALLLGLSGCVSTGKPHVSCPVGISVPFVFVGINACPNAGR